MKNSLENRLKLYLATYPCHLSIAYSLLDYFDNDINGIFSLKLEDLLALNIPNTYANKLVLDFNHSIRKILRWLEQDNHFFLTPLDENYPSLLKHIHMPPLGLFILGNPGLLSKPQMGIVGSRRASFSGLKHSFEFAKNLAQAGLIITSGLALGIDAAAHQGALASGKSTIAILGTGVDYVYPRQHQTLYKAISEQGAIVSEFPLGSPPKPEHFPLRNRIISGLSLGCLIIEASEKSGSLITARYALEQNREIFALPGSINNPNSKGCNQLIRSGAMLVEHAKDILATLNWKELDVPIQPPSERNQTLTKAQTVILEQLSDIPLALDCLNHALKSISQTDLMSELLQLEIQGKIAFTAGGYILV